MTSLHILITNCTLATRTGTETYVRDLAVCLLRRGHTPIVYTPDPGPLAGELARATVAVIDDLDNLTVTPDVIHGHHHAETMTALLRFPGVPAVYVCHDRLSWHDLPPRFPRILRYVAVDYNCRERFVLEHGIPAGRVAVLPNAVDLARFPARDPLPASPRRALVFSNYAREGGHLAALREACGRAGIRLDVVGAAAGNSVANPEAILGAYDLVFAKARSALEALAVGAAVILCDVGRLGPLVTADRLDELRRLNFGLRTLTRPTRAKDVLREIAGYDPVDASEVSRRVRASAGLEASVDDLLDLYREVIREYRLAPAADPLVELRAAAAYLGSLALSYRKQRDVYRDLDRAVTDSAWWQQEKELAEAEAGRLRREVSAANDALAAVHGSLTLRLRARLARLPGLHSLVRVARWLARRLTATRAGPSALHSPA